jgi:hypothetical protein
MIAQLDMMLFRPKVEDGDEHLARLLNFLCNRGWRTAREIEATLGSPFSDRYIRKLAEKSEGRLIGCDLGYKPTSQATPEELSEWRGRYISQIKRMQERVSRTEKAWHSREGA